MLTTTIPLQPKDPDGPLRVIILGRVSTPHQDKQNISASYQVAEDFLRHGYGGPTEIKYLGEQASGMRADRATILEAYDLIDTGEFDAVIVEDLSRIFRNPQFQWAFVQSAVNQNTRVICIADNLDTADDNWEVMMHMASVRHGFAVPDARRRVRRTATHSFERGGMVQKVRFGYRKLSEDEAASGQFGPKGLRIARQSECTAIIQEMRARVLGGANCRAVADWLQSEGIETGRYVKSGKWTGKVVETLLRDPILSGTRTFRHVVYQQVFKTGKYRRTRNPNGPETVCYPELAHLTREEHAELLAVLDARKGDRQYAKGRDHPRWNQPRSRSLGPGQHARCGICGGLMYCIGRVLQCQNAIYNGPRTCWNHVHVDCEEARAKILPLILGKVTGNPALRNALTQSAWREFDRLRRQRRKSSCDIGQRIQDLEQQAENLATAIARGGELEPLVKKLATVDAERKAASKEMAKAESQENQAEDFSSCEDVAARLDEALLRMTLTSLDFADFLRQLMPEFIIFPVQALDCAQIRPRAKLKFQLDAGALPGELSQEVVVDLFEPPVHVKHLAACVAAKQLQPKGSLDAIAAQLGINRMAVKRALAYYRLMQKAGVSDPYQEVREKPINASRWKDRQNLDIKRPA